MQLRSNAYPTNPDEEEKEFKSVQKADLTYFKKLLLDSISIYLSQDNPESFSFIGATGRKRAKKYFAKIFYK